MSSFKYCPYCGKEIKHDGDFCAECGKKMIDNNIDSNTINNVIESKPVNELEKKGNIFAVVSLILYFVVPFLLGELKEAINTSSTFVNQIFGLIIPLSFMSGIIVLIVGRVKYPKNISLKIVMWVFIVSTIVCIILFIAVLAFCYTIVEGCVSGMNGCY